MSYQFPNQGVNAFSGMLSRTTNFTPYIQNLQQATGILANAAPAAANQANAGINNASGTLSNYNNTSQAYYQPYVTGGQNSYNNVLNLSGANPNVTPQQINNLVTANPSYQFNLDQQMDALNKSAAARGKLYSGQTANEIMQLASGYAGNQYQNAVNNNLNAAQLGAGFSQTAGQQTNQLGQNLGNLQVQQGQNTAEGTLAAANAQAQGLIGTGQAETAQTTALSNPYNFTGTSGGVMVDHSTEGNGLNGGSSNGMTSGAATGAAGGASSGFGSNVLTPFSSGSGTLSSAGSSYGGSYSSGGSSYIPPGQGISGGSSNVGGMSPNSINWGNNGSGTDIYGNPVVGGTLSGSPSGSNAGYQDISDQYTGLNNTLSGSLPDYLNNPPAQQGSNLPSYLQQPGTPSPAQQAGIDLSGVGADVSAGINQALQSGDQSQLWQLYNTAGKMGNTVVAQAITAALNAMNSR